MLADLSLAILHHVTVFSLFAVYAIRVTLVRPNLAGDTIKRLAAFDGVYGLLSLVALVVGFTRVVLSLKGWDYYSGYWVFWAKIAAFAIVGVLSIKPTIRFRQWLKAGGTVSDAEIAAVRPWMRAEGAFLLAILALAAMMARGVGY